MLIVTPFQIGQLGGHFGAAIVSALVERGAIDPLKVAAWAEMFAKQQAGENKTTAEMLNEFVKLLRSMATVPADAGRA